MIVPVELTSEQKLLTTSTERFLAKSVPVDATRDHTDEDGFEASWWERGAELGWTSMLVSPDHGGGSVSGEGLADLCLVATEMGRVVAPGPLATVNVVASALSDAANAAAHQDLIDGIVAGRTVAAWAVYEPGRPWDPRSTSLHAQRSSGGYRLNGAKDRVESGDQADHFLVTALTDEGLGQFVIPRDAAGVSVRRDSSLDTVRHFATVSLHDVNLESSALLKSLVGVEEAIERQLQIGIVLQCAETLGVIDRVFEVTTQWAFDRYSFGRPLASYQALKHRFADMKADLEACHATTEAAAAAVSADEGRAPELVSIAKSWVGQRATDIVQHCVQLHGGIALTTEHDLHVYLRRATVNRAIWGTPSEHRRRLADILCSTISAHDEEQSV